MRRVAPFAGIKGMNRDLAVSKFNSEFAYEIKNMRIMPNKENTLMALVNEIGTQYSGIELKGTPVGQAVLDDTLVIFTTTNNGEDADLNPLDRIYKIQFVNGELKIVNPLYEGEPIYTGFLNFDMKHPLETIVFYENEDLQKVYWVDGKNQPRVINIAADADEITKWENNSYQDSFNLIREMDLTETVTITRTEVANGLFHSGVIQYVFTYFDKYMQETNPFYTSPLYYTSYDNRGASPEDNVSNGFKIEINNADTKFDYIRIYSILRTSEEAEPTCKIVADVGIPEVAWREFKPSQQYDNNNGFIILGTAISEVQLVFKADDTYTLEDITNYNGVNREGEIVDISNGFKISPKFCNGIYWNNHYFEWPSDADSNIMVEKTGGDDPHYVLYFDNPNYNLDDFIMYVYSSLPVAYTDLGTTGSTADPTELLYLGGEDITAGTLEQKDNTLFFGDIKLNTSPLWKVEVGSATIADWAKGVGKNLKFKQSSDRELETPAPTGTYPYKNLLKLSSNEITTFKCGDTYRFGIQAQYKTGRWSDVVWLGDFTNDLYPSHSSSGIIQLPYAELEINDDDAIRALVDNGFVKLRPVMAISNLSDRDCVCQGVLCPTVYNVGDRYENGPFAQSSWFTRPNAPEEVNNQGTVGTQNYNYFISPTVMVTRDDEVVDNEVIKGINKGEAVEDANKGEWAEFRHNHAIPNCYHRNCEIQSLIVPPETPRIEANTDIDGWVSDNIENFFIDQSIVTLHSPEIEFNMDLRGIDTEHLKLRIIGTVPITAFASAIDIQTSTPALTYNDSSDIAAGFYKETVGAEHVDSEHGWKSLISAPMWIDNDFNANKNRGGTNTFSYIVYPWHRNGSLNNQSAQDENGYTAAMLDKKRMSNSRVSYRSLFQTGLWEPSNGITGVSIFDSDEMTMIRIPAPKDSSIPDINYYGNVDKVLTLGRSADIHLPTAAYGIRQVDGTLGNPITKGDDKDGNFEVIIINGGREADVYKTKGYPITISYDDNRKDQGSQFPAHNAFIAEYFEKSYATRGNDDRPYTATDPIRIKYKSTPHAVIALNHNEDYNTVILPTLRLSDLEDLNNVSENSRNTTGKYFWDKGNSSNGAEIVVQDDIQGVNIKGIDKDCGFLWLAELYRDVDKDTIYGGTSEEALENNIWIAAGEPVLIATINNGSRVPVTGTITLRWTQGDTFYMRYDHIKTYPYTTEDQNSVTDIISFMCETRINLDGRYDRNRGQVDNLSITPENFNLMNDVYNQANDFFTFNYLNSKKINLDNFRNVITWTKTKTAGDLVDTWTNVTVASTLDLDGDKGAINKLKRFNNELLAFQDTGISQILYNETMQIASTEGVPIEIANSGKVQGKRYLANQAGCINKWSMCETPAGLYFIDDVNKIMYLFNGQFGKLSEQFGFTSWINSQLGSMEAWNPIDFNNFVTYYDKCNHDIYFINKDYCLAFSESLGQFTSFYDYNAIPYFANLQDRGIWIGKSHFDTLTEHEYKLWLHNEGEYNSYFNETMPYWLTVVANPEMQMDKIFDNIEFRSDTYSDDLGLLHSRTFDTLRAYNEYQDTGEVSLRNIWAKPSSTSNLKKKFRIWRAIIPRDKNGNGRNRIRNPWTYLTLKMRDPQNYKTILHDLMVYYFDSLPSSSNNGNSNEE